MKKQMKWLLAALALAALATPAFAINADMTGTLSVRGISTNNFDGTDATGSTNQDHTRGMDQRFRLFTSVAANENVRGVLGLEIDNVWGLMRQGLSLKSSTFTLISKFLPSAPMSRPVPSPSTSAAVWSSTTMPPAC